MAKSPAFQWYPKDCDTDESVRAMDDAEFGFYVRCLNHAWLNNGLPSEIGEFARVMGKTPRQFIKLWARVSRCFVENSEKRFVNLRQEQQRHDQETFRNSRIEAAKSKWLNKTAMHVHPRTDARTMHVQSSASASATASAKPSSSAVAKEKEKVFIAPTPLEAKIDSVAASILSRHPQVRIDCSKEVVKKKLNAILKRHTRNKSPTEKQEFLEDIDLRHSVKCESLGWQKDGGEFAKSLSGYLAPTEDRYLAGPLLPFPQMLADLPGHMNPGLVGGDW